eukprot:908732-Amorphochlora_amoeboformis.AAC.2
MKTWDVLPINVYGVLTSRCLDIQDEGCLDSQDVGCLDSQCVTVNMWGVFTSLQGLTYSRTLLTAKLWHWAYGCLDSQDVLTVTTWGVLTVKTWMSSQSMCGVS